MCIISLLLNQISLQSFSLPNVPCEKIQIIKKIYKIISKNIKLRNKNFTDLIKSGNIFASVFQVTLLSGVCSQWNCLRL